MKTPRDLAKDILWDLGSKRVPRGEWMPREEFESVVRDLEHGNSDLANSVRQDLDTLERHIEADRAAMRKALGPS